MSDSAEPIRSDRSPDHPVVPDWLVNIAALGWRVLVTVALAAVVVWAALLLSTVTAAIVISVIAAAVFAPSVTNLRERGWSRIRAAAAVTVVVVLVAMAIVVFLVIAFLPFADQILDSVATGLDRISTLTEGLSADTIDRIESSIRSWASTTLAGFASAAATVLSVSILALFTTFFLLLDGDKAATWALDQAPVGKRAALAAAGRDALERVGRYFRGAAIVATIDAIASLVMLALLNVPLAAALALLVFVTGFIPYFGVLIAGAAIVLATLAASGLPAAMLLLVLIVAGKGIQSRFLDPVTAGRNAGIHPALVLIAVPIGAAISGIFGLFIVIPVVAAYVAVNGAVLAALDPGPAEEQPDTMVPGWLDRLAQWSWRLLVAFAVIGLALVIISSLPIIFIPSLFALFFAATLIGAHRALMVRGASDTVAAGIATGGLFVIVVGLSVLSVGALVEEAATIADGAGNGVTKVAEAVGIDPDAAADVVTAFTGSMVAVVRGASRAALDAVIILALTALLCFFFLRDGRHIWAWFLGRLPELPRTQFGTAGAEAIGVLSGYMVGTAAISAFGAATQFLIMWVLGIPLALPLAVLSFFGGFVPYIGSLITTGIALLVTIAVGTPTQIAVMVIFTLVFNIVQGNFVAPLVYGKAVNLHPAIVLLSIPAGAALAGVTGMLLIVPLLGAVATTWRTVLAAFGTEPRPAPRPAGPDPG